MFDDSTKKCTAIEPKRGELIYYENPYDVMTNSTLLKICQVVMTLFLGLLRPFI